MSGGCPGSDEDRRVDLLIRAMKREPLAFGMGFLDNDPLKKKKKKKQAQHLNEDKAKVESMAAQLVAAVAEQAAAETAKEEWKRMFLRAKPPRRKVR